MIRLRLAAFLRDLASRLDPSEIDRALQRANDAIAIRREHARSYGDEVEQLLRERNAEIEAEIRDAGGKRPTRFVRKLRVAK